MNKALIISALAASSAMYGAVVVPGGGTWQTLEVAPPTIVGQQIKADETVPGAGNAYWNNVSFDNASGSCANIGCYVTASGGFTGWAGSPALANPAYLGTATGGSVDFNFQGSTSGPATMLAEFTQFGSNNWMGWYDSTFFTSNAVAFTAANYAAGKWGVVFTGSDGPITNATFTPSSNFGLWFLNDFQTAPPNTIDPTQIAAALEANGEFTDSTLNNNGPKGDAVGNQHFALFATSAVAGNQIPVDYWVGIEDQPFSVADRDYQDMILHLKIVPEPGYYALLSLGLAGLGLVRRRMNKTSVN